MTDSGPNRPKLSESGGPKLIPPRRPKPPAPDAPRRKATPPTPAKLSKSGAGYAWTDGRGGRWTVRRAGGSWFLHSPDGPVDEAMGLGVFRADLPGRAECYHAQKRGATEAEIAKRLRGMGYDDEAAYRLSRWL